MGGGEGGLIASIYGGERGEAQKPTRWNSKKTNTHKINMNHKYISKLGNLPVLCAPWDTPITLYY